VDNATKITCTNDVAGDSTSFSAEIIDKIALSSAIDAEYSDGAARTTLNLNSVSFTPESWLTYSGALDSAISQESNIHATQTGVDSATTDITTQKNILVAYVVP
jgi:hypothetical protein